MPSAKNWGGGKSNASRISNYYRLNVAILSSSVTPIVNRHIIKGSKSSPSVFSCYALRGYFFTPVYSSTVFEEIVVVVFVLSPTCVYVAVVEIVLHALQLPKLTATQASTANINKNFFILLCFLVDVIDDLLFTELGH